MKFVASGGSILALAAAITHLSLAVAAQQLALVRSAGLSPWKGGGFGMFAAVDGLAWRKLRVWVEAPGRHEELELPPSLAELGAKAAVLPSPARLAGLAQAVAAREQRKGRAVSRVRIEVHATDFDPASLAANRRRLARHVHEAETGRP